MTNKELSQAIRKDLKNNGFISKDISVRVRDSLYDTAVRVTIKNPLIKISDIQNIVNTYEEIDRDQRTGEILAGCNTYVFVEYEYGIMEKASSDLIPTAEMVLANKEKYSGHKIADNGKKTAHITHYNGNEWILAEFDKEETGVYTYNPTYWIKCANDLAVAMWRFKNLGSIYA